ncbi:MAG TPA: hypothetical protein PLT82_04570 [Candidatus Hydrogenedens sp.]|nr:hypothetical protein [Candidatus Hydrogenedens sp.]HOK09522.1 hypothetical protein [Candidatus Hydrogenedens sp.]HOL18796.1 hypothetical protein [Candidatus Hydrogenedens sp.]HPP58385.1 hypothetical protein [Candidatus Hydrogenedens sp.]
MSFFWLLITIFCIAWYFTMTFYVGVRGFFDIKEMLLALKSNDASNTKEE